MTVPLRLALRANMWDWLYRRDALSDLRWTLFGLILFSTIYWAAYSGDPNIKAWEGWWDQSNYLRSARAFAAANFAATEHFYPPGYSLLTAPFVRITPENPFLIPNYLCYILFYLGFSRLSRTWLPPVLTILCFGLGTLYPFFLLKQFIYPWNTIPIAALIVWTIALVNESAQDRNLRLDVAVGMAAGFVLAIRQAEVVVLLPAGIYYLYNRVTQKAFLGLIVATVAFVIPPSLVALVVLKISGALTLPYVAGVADIGFSASGFLRRAMYLFLDASIFNEPTAAIRDFQPFVIFLLPFSVVASLLAWRKFALAVVSCLAAFAFYITYNDFSPLNVVRYFLVHYIEWTFPLVIASGIAGISAALRSKYALAVTSAGAVSSLLLMTLKTHAHPDVAHRVVSDASVHCGTFALLADETSPINAIDFQGSQAPADQPVTLLKAAFDADGQQLRLFRDYRFLPVEGGMRVVFYSDVRARKLQIELPSAVVNPTCSADGVKPLLFLP